MTAPKIHSAYDPPPQVRTSCGAREGNSGRTQQHQKDECDINVLMSRFQKSGEITHLATGPPQYGDFSEVGDFTTAQNRVAEATQDFMTLPARLRLEFNNDPAELLEFLQDEANNERAIEMGLRPPMPTEEETPEETPPEPVIPQGGE